MNIRLKITLLTGLLLLLSLGFIFGQYLIERERANQLLEGIIAKQSEFFHSFADYAGAKNRFFAEDYSFWDDFVAWLHEGDARGPVWADENLTTSAENFEVHQVFIYDIDTNHIYSGDVERPKEELTPPTFTAADFERFRRDRLTHFYRVNEGTLTDFWMATVHPTTDPDRLTDPQGFLLIGERWDDAHLEEIEGLSGATLTKEGEALPPENDISTVTFPFRVYDLDGSVAATYKITTPVQLIGEAQRASGNQLIMITASSLMLLVLVYVFLEAWVGRPLATLSSGIKNKNIPLVKTMQNDRSEFGTLAKLVLDFSEHELVLQTKARNDAILSAVGSGLMAIDTDGKVTLFNTSAEELFKRPAKEIVGASVEDVFKAEGKDGHPLTKDEYPLMRAMKERKILVENLTCVRADGTEFPAVITAAPVLHDNAIIGAVQDLRDLTQEQMLERTKNNFVSLVSHELRTPLTLLRWSLEKLNLRTDLPKDVKSGVIPPMESAVHRTLTLASAILDVSKIEAGAFKTTSTEIKISSLVEKSLAELQPAIQDKKITVNIEKNNEASMTVSSDERLLQIIVNNVLSNATRYTEPGGRITVRLVEDKEKGVTFSVENTGPGIPAEEHPFIFKKMFRGEEAARQNPDGTGLGLYVTKSFIERLGGSISFVSEPNKSTTFTVQFPYKYQA